MSLKAPWLAVLIADGDEPSRADSFAPGKIIVVVLLDRIVTSEGVGELPEGRLRHTNGASIEVVQLVRVDGRRGS
jgi:hypothetical protein